VASFTDDVIIGIEEEERHNRVVEEIERLAKNILYVKPKKYK